MDKPTQPGQDKAFLVDVERRTQAEMVHHARLIVLARDASEARSKVKATKIGDIELLWELHEIDEQGSEFDVWRVRESNKNPDDIDPDIQ
jgi:hypothetical protein